MSAYILNAANVVHTRRLYICSDEGGRPPLNMPHEADEGDDSVGDARNAVGDQEPAVKYHSDQSPLLVDRVHLLLEH